MAATLGTTDDDVPQFDSTLRPRDGQDANGESMWSSHDGSSGDDDVEELDPRAADMSVVPVYVDIPDTQLRAIMNIALRAYNTHVLVPTRSTWRKEEGAKRELERDVERTAMREIAEDIKRDVTAQYGGSWHVVYGRDFATYVSHKRLSFCHFQLDGADVVVWRHGG